MRFKLIVVERRYQINLGYIARTAKNFGVKKLFFVKPRTKLNGSRAIMFAKHAKELLFNAKVYKNFNDSIKDCDIVIGTTGIHLKGKANFNRIYLLDETVKRIKKINKKDLVAGILIGRDDIGLKPKEIEKCDFVAYIGTNKEYPVLNISHALAIVLYSLTENNFKSVYQELSNKTFEKKELAFLFNIFNKSLQGKNIRNKKAVNDVFRRIIYSSQPNKQEIHALITALK